MNEPISVLLVDPSLLVRTKLAAMIHAVPGFTVAGTSRNCDEALHAIAQLDPRVVCLDANVPSLGGLGLVQEIMAHRARPIVVLSESPGQDSPDGAFPLLDAGAVDLCPKPNGGSQESEARFAAELIRKIRVAAGVYPISGPRADRPQTPTEMPIAVPGTRTRPRIVAVGAATGGPTALRTIFSALPADFPVPIVCVQHISDEFRGELVAWLRSSCRMRVTLADQDEICRPGTIYLPREHLHLEVGPGERLQLSPGPTVDGHRPSVSVLFRSVAAHYRETALGLLLTGMGSDGAQGLAAIERDGGVTMAQDEASCVAYGMPAVAMALGVVQHVIPLPDIAPALLAYVHTTPPPEATDREEDRWSVIR